MNYTHTARYKTSSISADALEELPGLSQSIGVECVDSGTTLVVHASSLYAIDFLSDMLAVSPLSIKVEDMLKPCVYLGRADMLIPTMFSIMPMFDDITFHATEDGMYAYGTREALTRCFATLPIIDETDPEDEII